MLTIYFRPLARHHANLWPALEDTIHDVNHCRAPSFSTRKRHLRRCYTHYALRRKSKLTPSDKLNWICLLQNKRLFALLLHTSVGSHLSKFSVHHHSNTARHPATGTPGERVSPSITSKQMNESRGGRLL
ncbi:Diaminopimelate dehydrogenase [Anopheles sinensis]|uniref:Diaminopimelate dehydrogenase n=1 Tax=Anopheles sinensis TaxID=74873 RepID=A0A084WT00_ANOSI|nr:Diaminopimelate dehydrogenase [Anopheles sinensis]